MKNNIALKLLTVIITLLLGFTCIAHKDNNVEASTIRNADVTTPASGDIFISLTGSFTTATQKAIVDRINAIRKEACNQGVIDPDTGKKLTAGDYKPVSWSSVLEEYAKLRAAETSVNWDHTRPNNKSPFTNNITGNLKGYHSGENIAAGYSILGSIEAYYEEKVDWVKKTGGMTGHYENIIRPRNTLVGIAGFKSDGYEYSAMEFGVSSGSNDTTKHDVAGTVTQLVEVNVNFLVSSASIKGASTVKAGSSTKYTAVVNMIDELDHADVYKGASWSSSNTGVATVDGSGNVKGIKAGTATIKVNVAGKSASKTITVEAGTLVTSVKLNVASKSLIKGQSFTLTSTIAPTNASNKKVTYKSSNTNVATVDANGKVTAKAAGSATITATSTDGSNKSATCKVTVTNPVKVTKITLNKTSLSIYKGYTYSLKATVTPTNATNAKVTYKSSNTNVATVDANGKITAKATGTATITATAADGSGKIATCKITVKNPVKVTGVKLNKTKATLKVKSTLQLTATIAPSNATNKNVTYKSSNTNIATVDSTGKVTAKAAGTVTITVTTKDGSKVATCRLTITK